MPDKRLATTMLARIGIGLVVLAVMTPGCSMRRLMAWEVVNSARGQPGNAGRSEALEYLNRHKASLRGIDLSHAWLDSIDLRRAQMEGVDLRHARIRTVDLSGANLSDAKLDSAWLWNVNLTGAKLAMATLTGARILYTDLRDADLRFAVLDGALIALADFDGADLRRSSLQRVTLYAPRTHAAVVCGMSLRGADLRQARLRDLQDWGQLKDLEGANIAAIKDAPTGFREWALTFMKAVEEPSDSGWQAFRDSSPQPPRTKPFSRWPERNWEAMLEDLISSP
jgi:hypothetical protein